MLFNTPLFLLAIPLIIALTAMQLLLRRDETAMQFSSGALLSGLAASWKIPALRFLPLARALALILIALALARPQVPLENAQIHAEGVDIVLAIDASTSMLAEDFVLSGKRRNRLDVVKQVVADFIRERKHDRIGIVAFAGRPYVVSPLTLDYGWLMKNLERVSCGMMEDGTAVGSGIAASLNRLKDTAAKSKIVILLTDGRSNAGVMQPLTAADAAAALGIKVYTIGAGGKGPAPYPMQDFFGRTVYQNIEIDLDEETLQQIAARTRARYFRATDTESLREIYQQIDAMEKTKIDDSGYRQYRELFVYFLIPGLFLLLLEFIAAETVLKRIP